MERMYVHISFIKLNNNVIVFCDIHYVKCVGPKFCGSNTDPNEQASANEESDSGESEDSTGQHPSCSKQSQQQVNVIANNGTRDHKRCINALMVNDLNWFMFSVLKLVYYALLLQVHRLISYFKYICIMRC